MWNTGLVLKLIALSGLGLTAAMQVIARADVAPCSASTVAYWRFDGGFTDSCGSIHGTPVGSASIATSNCAPLPGNSGCLVLNGPPSRVDLPAPFNPTHTGTLTAGTIEAWAYLEGNNETWAGSVIFNHGIAALYTDLNVVVRSLAGGGYAMDFSRPGSTYPDVLLPGFTLNSWHHLAWTWDGTTVTSYLDGVVQGTQAGPFSVPFTGDEAEIGSDDQEFGYWVGRLDEVRLSNRVLLPCEFLFQSPQCPTMSERGLIVMAGLVAAAGGSILRKRRERAT